MSIKKHGIVLYILLVPFVGKAQEVKNDIHWLHQSLSVIGRTDSRFGPRLTNDLYPEYTAVGRKDWFDFYGYADLPKFFGTGNHYDKGIWDEGSPLFIEIEPRFSIDNLTGLNLAVGPFKEWFIANDYVYDMGDNQASRQSTWYMGLGTDINTGLPIKLSANIYAKYQWQNYAAANENEWDGYRFKIKYSIPLTNVLGGRLVYSGFTNFDFGSDLAEKTYNNTRTNDAIASSHILSLIYEHWKFAFTLRYFHNGGQWNSGEALNFGDGPFELKNTGWGTYTTIGYEF
ncbi:nucleoside-specific channel-forming protein Tsx [Citrobacter enshiensis]|uniref:nucleoside-specific channel-forming protein Tsx n=1 Tax=Citrobacter enshiensis TaxID=2971264 RepID=UPI0023E7662B|nr:nucleoside-specific channel-forming protein Tsx [Citrobacter enshiensis]WET40478.1 nucleoside-specific channel-forming protein Tsx [Citrobacter enshiensis]